jgi:hypothetical protein
MLTAGTAIFVEIPGEADPRLLHAAKVTGAEGQVCTAELVEGRPPFQAGLDVFIYFEVQHRFMQQAARIEAILQTEPRVVIGFETAGEAVSAEARQCYRVSTVMADLTVTVADETCALLDVSATGFAVLATTRHRPGKMVKVTLHYRGEHYSGSARIQSVREMPGGRIRYGINAADDKKARGSLLKAQRQITMDIQRTHLRRLARG